MNHQQLLRILVAADVLLSFASVGAEGFFGWTLPSTLASYEHARFAEVPWSHPIGTFRFFVLAALTLCSFAAWIGLLSCRRFARPLFLVCTATSIFLLLISGPVVMTSIEAEETMST